MFLMLSAFLVILNLVVVIMTRWKLYNSTSDAEVEWTLEWTRRLMSLTIILNTLSLATYFIVELIRYLT